MDRINIVYKIVYPILGAIVAVLIVYLGYTMIIDNNQNNVTETPDIPQTTQLTFTVSEIEKANSLKDECLTVIENNVYRVPESYAKQHPGGYNQIASLCGNDSTSAFNSQHSSSKEAKNQLSKYIVGTLE